MNAQEREALLDAVASLWARLRPRGAASVVGHEDGSLEVRFPSQYRGEAEAPATWKGRPVRAVKLP